MKTGYPLLRPRHLKIHIAMVIFIPQNIRQDKYLLLFFDQSHGDSRYRTLDLNAGIHQGERGSADRRHRGRAIGFENLRNDPDGIGKRFG